MYIRIASIQNSSQLISVVNLGQKCWHCYCFWNLWNTLYDLQTTFIYYLRRLYLHFSPLVCKISGSSNNS